MAVSTRSSVSRLFSLSMKKRWRTLNRITAAIHTCVSPLDPKAFTDRSTVVSLRSIEPHRYYFRTTTPIIASTCKTATTNSTASVDNLCFYYYHCNSIIVRCSSTAGRSATIINNNSSHEGYNKRLRRHIGHVYCNHCSKFAHQKYGWFRL